MATAAIPNLIVMGISTKDKNETQCLLPILTLTWGLNYELRSQINRFTALVQSAGMKESGVNEHERLNESTNNEDMYKKSEQEPFSYFEWPHPSATTHSTTHSTAAFYAAY